MSDIQTKTEVRTSTVMILSMLAGVGLAQVEVSEWMRVFLAISSDLVERIFELAGGIALIASSGKMTAICAALLCSFAIGVLVDKAWHHWRAR